MTMKKLVGKKEVMSMLGYSSPVSLDNLEKRGLLPPRIRCGPNRVMWDLDGC